MKTEHDIEALLTSSKPELDVDARARLWSQIASKLPHARPITSPFLFTIFSQRQYMVPVAFVLVVLIGTGGLAAAAEASRPGDLLFPVERAFENVRLRVASSESAREALLRRYGEERLNELRDIITEEARRMHVADARSPLIASTTPWSLAVEAGAFTDMTVVKVELNDQKTTFMTEAQTRDAVIEAVLARFPFLTKEQVESVLTFEREDRVSRPKDRGEVTFSDGGVRVGGAITEVLTFLDETGKSEDHDVVFLEQLRDEVEGLRVRLDNDRIRERKEKSRFEWEINNEENDSVETVVRNERSRIRIEEKHGEIRIDIKEKHGHRDGGDDSALLQDQDQLDPGGGDDGEVRGEFDDRNDDPLEKGRKGGGRDDE